MEQAGTPLANAPLVDTSLIDAPLADTSPLANAPLASAPLANVHPAVPIISPHFCSPQSLDLEIVRKVLTLTDGDFTVTDINGNIIFKMKGAHLTLHGRRVLFDTAGHPIITLQKKLMTAHNRWEVFRGDSTHYKDLVFSAMRSSVLQLKTELDIFLSNNTAEIAPDFKVNGSWLERSCIVYAGNSSTNIVAQMRKKDSIRSVLFGKDNFMVKVYPGIDYAFIVAIIVILDEIN